MDRLIATEVDWSPHTAMQKPLGQSRIRETVACRSPDIYIRLSHVRGRVGLVLPLWGSDERAPFPQSGIPDKSSGLVS